MLSNYNRKNHSKSSKDQPEFNKNVYTYSSELFD